MLKTLWEGIADTTSEERASITHWKNCTVEHLQALLMKNPGALSQTSPTPQNFDERYRNYIPLCFALQCEAPPAVVLWLFANTDITVLTKGKYQARMDISCLSPSFVNLLFEYCYGMARYHGKESIFEFLDELSGILGENYFLYFRSNNSSNLMHYLIPFMTASLFHKEMKYLFSYFMNVLPVSYLTIEDDNGCKPIDFIVHYLKVKSLRDTPGSYEKAIGYRLDDIFNNIVEQINQAAQHDLIQFKPEYFMILDLWSVCSIRWSNTTVEHITRLLRQMNSFDSVAYIRRGYVRSEFNGGASPRKLCPGLLSRATKQGTLTHLSSKQWLTLRLSTSPLGSNVLQQAMMHGGSLVLVKGIVEIIGAETIKNMKVSELRCNLLEWMVTPLWEFSSSNDYVLLIYLLTIFDDEGISKALARVDKSKEPKVYFLLKYSDLTKLEYTNNNSRPIHDYTVVKLCRDQELRQMWRRLFCKAWVKICMAAYCRPPQKEIYGAADTGGPDYLRLFSIQTNFLEHVASTSQENEVCVGAKK